MNFFISAHSQRGTTRNENQDTVQVPSWHNTQRDRDSFASEYSQSDIPTLLLIADGIGGHVNGALASLMAVQSLKNSFETNQDKFNEESAVEVAHTLLTREATNETHPMGTTIVGLVLGCGEVRHFNVGDSKCLHISGLEVEEISIEDRVPYGRGKAITQSLGGGTYKPIVHKGRRQYRNNDKFVLSSDGLTDHLSNEEIIAILNMDSENHASELSKIALENGSEDDISVIVAEIR